MFLSKRSAAPLGRQTALTGPVTVDGQELGAWLEGERRGLAVYAPAGYRWAPFRGQEVLVLKAGESGELPCALGVAVSGEGLGPGEVELTTGKASIRLSPDGSVELTGVFTVNGTAVGPAPEPEGE